MKHYFIRICVVAALCAGCSKPRSEDDLFDSLTKCDVKSLETVLKTPDEYSAMILYAAAGAAFADQRLEDSGFLFYAGQLRARFDQKCFPPTETGGDNPFVLYSAFSQGLGSTINPAVMAEPKAFSRAIDRLEKWSPKAPDDYTPGYEFKQRLSEKDGHEAARQNRTEFLSRMRDFSTLLNNPDYFAAFRVIQARNLLSDDKRPTKEDAENATKTMIRIESEKGLTGFFSMDEGAGEPRTVDE